MTGSSRQQAIDGQLAQLRDASTLAHREVEQALPVIRPHGEDVVLRLDPRSNRVVATIPVGRGASGVAVGTA